MKARGFELPKGRALPESKAKVTKAKATGVKKRQGKKIKEVATNEEEAQASSNEGPGSGDEQTKDGNEVAAEDEKSA